VCVSLNVFTFFHGLVLPFFNIRTPCDGRLSEGFVLIGLQVSPPRLGDSRRTKGKTQTDITHARMRNKQRGSKKAVPVGTRRNA